MSTSEQRLAANRANALGSTGPTTTEGKTIASRNATRHGLLSLRLLLADEEPALFERLLSELSYTLGPTGAAEETLVERIAVTIWRQRRLVHAETANLELARQPKKIAAGVSSELGRGFGSELKQDELAPVDAEQEAWCRAVVAELEALEELDLANLEQHAPRAFGQLTSDAEEDHETPAKFIADHKDGLPGYVAQLSIWCREQIRHADARPHLLSLAQHVRAKGVVLPTDKLELFTRYQTTLDNQMFKLLRALREAQEWRLKTLEQRPLAAEAEDVTYAV